MDYPFGGTEGSEFVEFSLGNLLQKTSSSTVCDPCLRVSSSAVEIDNDFNEMVLSPSFFSFASRPEEQQLTFFRQQQQQSLKPCSSSLLSSLDTPLPPQSGFPLLQGFDCSNNNNNNNNNTKGFVGYKKVKGGGQHLKENNNTGVGVSSSGEEGSVAVKRARISSFSSQPPICQVHGCFRDLSTSKDYYRRHRVCNEHSKSVKVLVDGIEQRFCQQCSRFHLLPEFDDDKRSCRKSLAGHNERRRKPQYDTHQGQRFFDTTSQTTPFFLPELLPGNYSCQENYKLDNNSSSRPFKLDNSNEKHISFSKLEPPHPPRSQFLHALQKPADSSKNTNLGDNNNLIPLEMDWDFAKSLGIRSLTTAADDQLRFGVLEMEAGRCDVVLDGNIGVYYEAEVDDHFGCAESGGATIDLQQLSTHLLRVEQQRNSDRLKLDNNLFCCFTSG